MSSKKRPYTEDTASSVSKIAMNKRAISDVVTTVLVVLLTIVAIAILWTFLQPLFVRSGERVQQAEACISIILEIPSCVVGESDANATVKRGAGAADLKEIKLIFEKEDGSTVAVNQSETPRELETKFYSVNLGFKAKSVAVAAGLADSKGVISYCNPIQPVDCRQ